VAVGVDAILFILISLFVFVENDESQPIKEIFQLGFLIPVTIYSLFSLWVSFGLFLLLDKIFSNFITSKMVSKFISFPPSLVIGIPIGLIALDRIVRLITA
jgi:hypothetical protein